MTQVTPVEVRFWSKVQKTDTCWLWIGQVDRDNYGQLHVRQPERKTHKAHRLSYQMHVGPIPKGHHIDHLCRVRNCVNPAHLEAVTPKVNNERSESLSAQNLRKTRCPKGHPYTVRKNGKRTGGPTIRCCRLCENAQRNARRAAEHARGLAAGVAQSQQRGRAA